MACFDHAIAALERQGAAPEPKTECSLTPEQKFGLSSAQVSELESKSFSQPLPPAEVHAHIVSIEQRPDSRQVFVLDNSQVWQQIEFDPAFAARKGYAVTISKGALGSFWLATDPHQATRVKRIR